MTFSLQGTEMIPAWIDGELQQVEKLAVHQRGLRHKAVSVFVVSGDHVLLQRRAEGKYHTPGLWANSCCTHPRWGEEPAICALRRLREELGIIGLKIRNVGQIEYRADVGMGLTEHELVDVFLASTTSRPGLLPDAAEVAETAWVTLSALEEDLATHPQRHTPWLHIYLKDHRARIFSKRPL